jgi:hypothetical protein
VTRPHWTISRRLHLEELEQRLTLSAQSWNLLADFDLLHNPDGPWSYSSGPINDPVGDLNFVPIPMPLVVTNWQGIGVDAWTRNGQPGAVPGFGIATLDHGGGFGQLSGDLMGHSSFILRWTSPVTGTVNFSGSAFHPRTIGRTNLLIMREKGEASLASERHTLGELTDVNTRDDLLHFSQDVDVAAGQTVDLMVGPGQVEFFAFTELAITAAVRGDYNRDGITDAADYTVWRDNLGNTGAPGTVFGDGTGSNLSGNPNGIVDQWDYDYWRQHFGDTLEIAPRPPPPQYHPAAIVVQTSGVTLPDGSLLNITGTQTQGLQEAISYSAQQGWDVFVLPGSYTLNAHLDFDALQLRSFRFEDVTLNFTSNVTDFGIRFDSTMLTNWYWKGGAINAPSATDGVLFQPRSPHPLDGIKLGTKGVVDSAFHFNVDIFAGAHKVTMNTQQATINDLTFYFNNVLPNQINYVGGGFASYNIAEAARTDDPIPFDLLSTAGRVTVIPPETDISAGLPGTVFLPDGSILDITGTQTFGLQEAFDYATVHDLDVVVFGRGVRNIAPFTNLGLYNTFVPWTVGDLTGRTYRLYGVTIGNPNPGDLLTVGDMVNSSFEITGQVVGPTADNVIVIQPDAAGVQNSWVRIQAAVGNNGVSNTAVRIDPSLTSIQNSLFHVHEVNMGYFGIKVMNPSAVTEFSNNLVRTLHTHGTGHIGVQIGENETNGSRIYANTLEVRTSTDGTPAEAALQVWGDFNTLDLFAFNSGLHFGAKFEPGSNNNTLFVGTIQAGTPIANYGTNNSFIALGAGSATLSMAGTSSAADSGDASASNSALAATLRLETMRAKSLELLLVENASSDQNGILRKLRARFEPSEDEERARDAAFSNFTADIGGESLQGQRDNQGTRRISSPSCHSTDCRNEDIEGGRP